MARTRKPPASDEDVTAVELILPVVFTVTFSRSTARC
jgi:hypothetical protein